MTLRARALSEWCFNSRCSRHMTGDKSFFTSVEDFNGGNVTFGDSSVTHVRGRGRVSTPRCLDLDEILIIDGLKINLISISQTYDIDFSVKFS